MTTEETLQNLKQITRLYFRGLRCQVAKTKFYMDRKELRILGISTVKKLRLEEEGSWPEHIRLVMWNQQEFGKNGVCYRDDLLRQRIAGELEHIPNKAEVDRIYFKEGSVPLQIIRDKLQELRIDIEEKVSGEILAMCRWPGKRLFEDGQDSSAEQKYLSCFRMLERMIKPKAQPPSIAVSELYETASGNAGDTKNKDVLTGEAKALAMLVEHPDWPDTKIAKTIGVNRTTLYDWPKFKKAKEALKQGQKDLPKGSKSGETGNMEAWD